MYDIISIGDTTIDHFFFIHDASTHCGINKEDCYITLHFADKIAVDKYVRTIAGNATNNAVASSRLGLKTAFYAVIGDDMQGHSIHWELKKENVSTKFLQIDKKNATNISSVISFKGERTILVYHAPRNYQLPKLPKSKWVYLTSAGPKESLPKLHRQVAQYLKNNPNTKLGFNPGTHQMHLGLKAITPFIKRSDVLSLNVEETERLLGCKSGTPHKKLLADMYKIGPKIFVMTNGPQGSYAFDGKTMRFLEIYDTPILERTGCGDSYTSGFIAALAYGHDVSEAMRWGTMNSAFVIQEVGPQKGLLYKAKMLSMLKKAKELQPKVI